MAEFLSIGYGNVGQAVPERCEDLGLEHSRFVVKRRGVYERQADGSAELYDDNPAFWENEDVIGGVEVAFVTIPSDQDQRELEIIEALQDRGITVVTAAKGALANHFGRLEPRIDELGKSATLGGGARILPHMRENLNPRITQIHVVPNGTLNYIMHGIDQGETPGQIIDRAVILKYAEPGSTSHIDVLNGELIGDIPRKASILYNVGLRPGLRLEQIISPDDVGQPPLTRGAFEELITEADGRRYILSIIREHEERAEKDAIAGFRQELEEGWVMIGGFRRMNDNPLFKNNLRLRGVRNGIVMACGPDESDGPSVLVGEGAGPGPTAASMAQDARQLLSLGVTEER